MKIILKPYQEKAVESLTEKSYQFLSSQDNVRRMAVLQAPTGSGKTVMMASFIESLINKNKESDKLDFTFIWLSIGKGDLHNQSKRSLEKIFAGYPKVTSIDSVFGTSQFNLEKDSVMIVNWEKIRSKDGKTQEWKTIAMRDGDHINFREMLDNTHTQKRKTILIIDESHSNTKTEIAKDMINLIGPSIIIEVSATPLTTEKNTPISEKDNYHFETINPQDVIDQQMIKNQILVNFDFVIDQRDDSDETILRTAIEKRDELAKVYKENDIDINPLLLIQLPNSENGEVVKSTILNHLLKNRGVAEGDERLAMWLDDTDKAYRNIDSISNNNGLQEYLIFKQAIDTGWDCPRAQILLKFRESESEVFNIQVLGRILRMPEQKHYDIDALNKAYVYTNNQKAEFKIEDYNPKILGDQPAKRDPFYKSIALNSFYRERADYQDIKADFKKVLLETFLKEMELKESDFKNNRNKLISLKSNILGDLGWQFEVANMSHEVIKDMVKDIKSVDDYNSFEDDDGVTQSLKVNDRQVEFISKDIMRSMMAPFTNVVRSVKSMNVAWYLTCRSIFGEELTSSGPIGSQTFLILNKDKIRPIFLKAVAKYSVVREKKAKEDTEHYINNFEIIEKDYFNHEVDEKIEKYTKHILQPCWLSKTRSVPEREFEVYLESLNNVEWWYKNGVNRSVYLGIKYEFDNQDGKDIAHTFYPDYIVRFDDNRLGIFETKHENDQDRLTKTKAKQEALAQYIEKHNQDRKDLVLIGGILINKSGEWYTREDNGDAKMDF